MSPQTWAGINTEVLGQPGPQMLEMLRRFSLVAAVLISTFDDVIDLAASFTSTTTRLDLRGRSFGTYTSATATAVTR